MHKLVSKLARGDRRLRYAPVFFCVALVGGCQTETVVLSPAMHARIVDGVTRKPLAHVRVTLVSRYAAATSTAYSNESGFVDMPGLVGENNVVFRATTDIRGAAVHAIFQRPGYQSYTIDSVNGYGFFKGHTDVHLYPD